MYTQGMAMTATQLRKNLFHVLEDVAQGKPAELEYKGRRLRIVSASNSDWQSMLVKRDLGGNYTENESGWSLDAKAEWEDEWKHLLPAKTKAKTRTKLTTKR
jgi:hypothetical protein